MKKILSIVGLLMLTGCYVVPVQQPTYVIQQPVYPSYVVAPAPIYGYCCGVYYRQQRFYR